MNPVPESRLRRAGFALPALPLNSLVVIVFVFLPPLYADYQGLGPAAVGSIFLIAKLFDIIAAPIFGTVMDTHKTRWGRRRPWLVLAVPILMLSVYMVSNPPESAGTLYLLLWLTALYMGWDAWTISHTSWALELSDDYDQRSRITSWLQYMVIFGGLLVSMIPAIMERISSPTYEEKVSTIALWMLVVLPLSVLICLFSAPERNVPQQPPLGFRRGLSVLLRSMALVRLLISNALLTFSTYFVQGLFVFFVTYTLNLEDQVGFILTFLIVGGLFCLPIWVRISESWNKHKAVQAAVLVGLVTPLLLLVLPPNNVVLAALTFLIVGANSSANEFLPRTMIADICDADQLQTGSQRMGLYYSLLQISSKVTGGLGIFIGFSFLAYFGFDPSLGDANPKDAVERLRLLIVILPIIAYCIVIGLMWKYPITRERQREMRSMIHQPNNRHSGEG